MIKVKHLIWIICVKIFFCLVNIGIQANYIISLRVYSEHATNEKHQYIYSPSTYLFGHQRINFHFMILSIMTDSLCILINSVILLFLYKQPYSLKIYRFQIVNYVFLVLKFVFTIAAHVQDVIALDKDSLSPICIETDNTSRESQTACNLIFSQKFFIIFLYISLFFSFCMIFSFRFYYNIFLNQSASPQNPISMDLKLPLSSDSKGQHQKKSFSLATPSYLTNATTKKSSGKLDAQTIQDLEMTIQQHQQKQQKKKNANNNNGSSPFSLSACNPYTSNTSQNDQNFFSNQVRAIDVNTTSMVLQTQNAFNKSGSKLQSENSPRQSQQNDGNEGNEQQLPEKQGSTSLYMFSKKNKSNPQMERPSIRINQQPEEPPVQNQQQNQLPQGGERHSIYSQRSSFGLSSIPFPNSNFSRSNTQQSQGIFSNSQFNSNNPKRFSLSLYKCSADSAHSPIKVFNKTEMLHSSIILNIPSPQNNPASNSPASPMSDCYEESTFECFDSPALNPADRIPQNVTSSQNTNNFVIDSSRINFGNSQPLVLKKSESEQIYEESDESDQSYYTSDSNQNSVDLTDEQQQKYNHQSQYQQEQNQHQVPNKYFRTDRTPINPLALAPSTAIIGNKISSTAATQIGNALGVSVKSPITGGIKPFSSLLSKMIETITK